MYFYPANVRWTCDESSGLLLDIENDKFFALDQIGVYILTRLLDDVAPAQIAHGLSVTTGHPSDDICNDIRCFIGELEARHLLAWASDGSSTR